jgi:hypothetical protein
MIRFVLGKAFALRIDDFLLVVWVQDVIEEQFVAQKVRFRETGEFFDLVVEVNLRKIRVVLERYTTPGMLLASNLNFPHFRRIIASLMLR